ncbi:MAG: hypothetical protein GY742_00850 [Hyphomicrobiales bacterium]|nr:hypothetical protein [Hyphomicrobiales bacterium]
MNFTFKMVAGVAAVTTCAVLLLFFIPAHADHNVNPTCTTIKEDVDHLEKVLIEMGNFGKVWLWHDDGFSMIIAASPVFKKGHVLLSFYDGLGCLMPHPYTGEVRTSTAVTDKIKSYVAKSKLFWSNTDEILLTTAGFTI